MSDQNSPPGRSGLARGTRLNGIYEIESPIAEGGMGAVYKAHNIQTGDPVAIKVVLAEHAGNEDAMALFRREASMLHTLHHEAIVRYYVFTVDPELARAYLAMEFVDGPSLSDVLEEGPLPIGAVRHLLVRLSGGLAAAHQRGVVHRDLSPDNVILPDGDVRQAKIIDFGIARSTRPGEGTLIGGAFAGKYNWVSPEQLGLYAKEVDARSDVYSLGLLLAAAMLGRPLDMDGTQAEIVDKRRRVPDLAGIDPSMRPLLTAMLQPDPEDRIASMVEVARRGMDRTVEPWSARPLPAAASGVPQSPAARSAPEVPPAPASDRPVRREPVSSPSPAAAAGRRGGPALFAGIAVLALLVGGVAVGWRTGFLQFGGAKTAEPLVLRTEGGEQAALQSPPPEPEPSAAPPPVTEAPEPPAAPPPVTEPQPEPPAAPAPVVVIAPEPEPEPPPVPAPAPEPVVPPVAVTPPPPPVADPVREPEPEDLEPPAKQMPPDQIVETIMESIPDAERPPAPAGPAPSAPPVIASPPSVKPLELSVPVGDTPPTAPETNLPGGPSAEELRERLLASMGEGSGTAPAVTPQAEPPPVAALQPPEPPPIAVPPAAAPAPPPAAALPASEPPAPLILPQQNVAPPPLATLPDPPLVSKPPIADPPVTIDVSPPASEQADRPPVAAPSPPPRKELVLVPPPDGLAAPPSDQVPEPEVALLPPAVSEPEANRPPLFPASSATPPAADLGRSYVATLPRFVDPEGGGVTVTVDGDTPPGLAVFWKPDGTVQISGIGTLAGTFPFRLVARDRRGAATVVPVTLTVVETGDNPIRILPPGTADVPASPAAPRVDTTPQPPPLDLPPPPSVATLPPPPPDVTAPPPANISPTIPAAPPPPVVPADRTVLGFLAAFEGGACFFARPLVAEVTSAHIEGFGSAVEGFQRLESNFMKDFGTEPRIDVRMVDKGQCPAVEFLAGLGAHRHDAPMISLDNYDVGGAVPLSGRIVGVPSGALTVLLVGNDGVVSRLDPLLTPTADGASFSIPIQADAASKGVPQLLLAIATTSALASLPDSGQATELFPSLAAELGRSGADVTVDAAMFKVGE